MNLISNKIFLNAITDKNKWENLFKNAAYLNISQDWLYSEIKSELGDWEVERFEIIFEEQTIAITQVYFKRIFNLPFFRISYINRGPIFLKECSALTKLDVLRKLANFFSLKSGNVLFINPFVDLSIMINYKKIFNLHYGRHNYSTSYIDLSQSLIDLRKTLKSKWRNQLNSSEKNGFIFTFINESKYDEIIFKSYKEMQSNKNFSGASSEELFLIFKKFNLANRIFRFLLFDENNTICAFMIFLSYGNQVVYYLGWVSEDFRKMNPSNYLMWNAIIRLKEYGFLKLDLGGIDSINTPGVAKFKQGIGGVEFNYPSGYFSFF